jgi:7,8-dihydropterin-6-yl-methyl-4-(beta-D-ribofuranosyl)aminobenzene 5'-phosphate synthase
MKVLSLIENISNSENLYCEHGLSLFVQTDTHKILFDTGASENFIKNAESLGVDLREVDIAVVSHGHFDHGGGLKAFLELNKKASVYISKKAFEKYYAKREDGTMEYIGLDRMLFLNDRFILTQDYLKIDDGLELFSGVKGNTLNPTGNKVLFMQTDTHLQAELDTFEHEQNLLITQEKKSLLLAGCAHRGIVNIIDHMHRMLGKQDADVVIGGFHLFNLSKKNKEDIDFIRQIADRLKNTKSTFYTCHCTGTQPYEVLKEAMGKQINYLATGDELII